MNENWFDRLVELIRADGRGMKTISRAAGFGENYIQQMIKDGKRPSVDKFMQLLEVLGGASAIYVLTGFKISSADLEMIKRLSSSDERHRQAILTLLEGFQADQAQE